MKLIMENWRHYLEEIELEEGKPVTFSAKNFPIDGNEKFTGAGERTPHATSGKEFPVVFKTVLVGEDGSQVPVPEGTKLVFVKPWKLYTGAELQGVQSRLKRSTFAKAEVDGLGQGYINIRAVGKPSGGGQSRVQSGSTAQDKIMGVIQLRGEDSGVSVEKVSSAPPGSTKPDLVVNYGGKKIQFEVKGRNSARGFVTVFDKSVRRGAEIPIVEAIVKAFIAALDVTYEVDGEKKSSRLGSALGDLGLPQNLEGVLGFYNKYVDPSIGFCGDPSPVPRSGKLPRDFVTTDQSILSLMKGQILKHLRESGDDYFVIYTRAGESADIYSTGGSNNPLDAIEAPDFVKAGFMTYGGCSNGATRVGFKVQLASQDSNLPEPGEAGQ